jgi:hypothetical protein
MVVDLVPPGTIQLRAAKYSPMLDPLAGSPKEMDWAEQDIRPKERKLE